MSNRAIVFGVAGLAAVLLLGWFVVRSRVVDPPAPTLGETSGSVQPLSPEEATPTAGRGQKGRQRNDGGPDYPWISAQDLKARLDRGEKVLVLNTRPNPGDPVIKGALEVSEDDIETWADKMPKSTSVVTYCSCKDDSAGIRAALKLRWREFEDVHVLRGGIDAWQEAGYPIQPSKTREPSTR